MTQFAKQNPLFVAKKTKGYEDYTNFPQLLLPNSYRAFTVNFSVCIRTAKFL